MFFKFSEPNQQRKENVRTDSIKQLENIFHKSTINVQEELRRRNRQKEEMSHKENPGCKSREFQQCSCYVLMFPPFNNLECITVIVSFVVVVSIYIGKGEKRKETGQRGQTDIYKCVKAAVTEMVRRSATLVSAGSSAHGPAGNCLQHFLLVNHLSQHRTRNRSEMVCGPFPDQRDRFSETAAEKPDIQAETWSMNLSGGVKLTKVFEWRTSRRQRSKQLLLLPCGGGRVPSGHGSWIKQE